MFFALIFAAASAGSSSAARMAMMAITTSNSISVKPARSVSRQLINLSVFLHFNIFGFEFLKIFKTGDQRPSASFQIKQPGPPQARYFLQLNKGRVSWTPCLL
jgi:hypothetical protein